MSGVFCFGFGYVASQFADMFKANYTKIVGTSSKVGKDLIRFDHTTEVIKTLNECQYIVVSIPPTEDGCPVSHKYAEALSKHHHIIYLSATNVYGDHDGQVVIETSECRPTGNKGKHRLLAESQWQTSAKKIGCHLTILRLSGIYGPGRSILDRLETITERIHIPGHKFSRIHVADIATVLHQVFQKGVTGIFNLADDYPAPTKELIEYACDVLGKPYPPPVNGDVATLGSMETGFYRDNKIVGNQKMKEHLHASLLYPSYKEGLVSIVRASVQKLQ